MVCWKEAAGPPLKGGWKKCRVQQKNSWNSDQKKTNTSGASGSGREKHACETLIFSCFPPLAATHILYCTPSKALKGNSSLWWEGEVFKPHLHHICTLRIRRATSSFLTLIAAPFSLRRFPEDRGFGFRHKLRDAKLAV